MSDHPDEARPLVTVLVPARDEAGDIAECLEAIGAQDYPLDALEVIVVDGASRDGTGAAAAAVLRELGVAAWSVIDNPAGSTPSSLNCGLEAAKGDYLCRVDARSMVPPDYVRRCVDALRERPDVMVSGGSQIAKARAASSRAQGIARALNNRIGMGFARYRRGGGSGATDTVYLGTFRTEQLRAIGGWDERFTTNQDFDLNRRMGALGVVWFEAGLPVGYLPRADVAAVFAQYHRFGRWKVRYWRWTATTPVGRQLVILAVPPTVGLAALAWSRGRPHRVALLAGLGAAGLVAVDQAGHQPGAAGDAATRAWSAGTLAAVWAGFLSGVAREGVNPSGPAAR